MKSRRPWSQRLRWSRRTTAPRLTGVQGVRQPSLQTFGAHFVLAHRRRCDSGCATTRTGASTDGHGKGQTTGGFEAFGNVTTVGCGNSLWSEGAEQRWGRREDPPSCSGTCSRRKEAAFSGARIIWPGGATRRRGTAQRQPPAAHAGSGAATSHCGRALQTGRLFFRTVDQGD